MDTRKSDVDAVVGALVSHGDFATGANVVGSAKEWLRKGFSAAEVGEWLDARCFDPEAARAFCEWGLRPEHAAVRTGEGIGGYEDTLGYKLSNNDIGLRSIRQALQRPDLGR